MLKKILMYFIIFILLIPCFMPIIDFFGIFDNSNIDYSYDKGGIYFFAELIGLIIPHLTFFLASYYWTLIIAPAICGFLKIERYSQTIAFIPIFIIWLFFFVIYVLDYGVSFFYFHGGYETLRKVDLF